MNFLKKLFIKNYKDTSNPEVRLKYGTVAGVFGIITNAVLCVMKIIIGIIGSSITIIADAVNNLSDAGSSIITVFGFKLSGKPADKDHPFGHERFEYITALIVALLVLAIGVVLGKSSVDKIIEPEPVTVTTVTYIILSASIILKLVQMFVYMDFGKSINSNALKASAADSRNDIISTFTVLVASILIGIFSKTTDKIYYVDGCFGLAVSIFIVISSLKLIKETINPLLGSTPEKEEVEMIQNKLLSYNGVLGIHDLMIHKYGASYTFVVVHIEVDSKVDINISHDMIDNIERDFIMDLKIHLAVHMDPIETDNPVVNRYKEKITTKITELGEGYSIHDFRIVSGQTHTNILFDVVVPFNSKFKLEDIEAISKEALSDEDGTFFFILGIDKNYIG